MELWFDEWLWVWVCVCVYAGAAVTEDDVCFRGAEYETSLCGKQQVVESEHRAKYVITLPLVHTSP